MLDKETIEKIIREAISKNADEDFAREAAREELISEMSEAWWDQVYTSSIPWLDKVIDRDAISARVEDEVDGLLDTHFWELWKEKRGEQVS